MDEKPTIKQIVDGFMERDRDSVNKFNSTYFDNDFALVLARLQLAEGRLADLSECFMAVCKLIEPE